MFSPFLLLPRLSSFEENAVLVKGVLVHGWNGSAGCLGTAGGHMGWRGSSRCWEAGTDEQLGFGAHCLKAPASLQLPRLAFKVTAGQ